MQRLDVSGAVRLIYKSLGFEGLTNQPSKLDKPGRWETMLYITLSLEAAMDLS